MKSNSRPLGHPSRGSKRGQGSESRKAQVLLLEDAATYDSLRKIVAKLTGDPFLQQDMLQECLFCLWRVGYKKPGRTRSWYLQNCRFHVQHLLASGRSVDSPKRMRADRLVSLEATGDEGPLEEYNTNGELFESVSFQDTVSALACRLNPNERAVLHGLADGFVLRDIADRSGLSYPTALKYRRKIAALTVKLGIVPEPAPETSNGHHAHSLAPTKQNGHAVRRARLNGKHRKIARRHSRGGQV